MEDRSRIRERHGVANARKMSAADVENSETTHITVVDGPGEVFLAIGSQAFPAALTPDQARAIARMLQASADRVEAA